MLSDKIIALKSYDAGGNQLHTYKDGTNQPDNYSLSSFPRRSSYGSNIWSTSNIRAWLNSTKLKVIWPDQCPPNRELRAGGDTILLSNIKDNISTIVNNYDSAFYEMVSDQMFLLDVKQLNRIEQNKTVLGNEYYLGKMSTNLRVKEKMQNVEKYPYWLYWLRTPDAYDSLLDCVRFVDIDKTIASCMASNGAYGIRPAFYVELSKVSFQNGSGSDMNPYML